jgi:hypothetical protein
MSRSAPERVSVDPTPDKPKLVSAALCEFEPYWPSGHGRVQQTKSPEEP